MSGEHHTRVYGGLANYRLWLSTCVKAGMIPDVIFTVGRRYVVATSERGALFIRYGPRGPREVSSDPTLFSRRLRQQARGALLRHMTDCSEAARVVRWKPDQFAPDEENSTCPVS